jgi:WXXGXW repeat (2 copies)
MKLFTRIFIPLMVLLFAVTKTNAQISVSISVGTPPPELPVYVQPACPTDGYLWVPGYWAYDNNDGYYWVPGVWVAAPQPGYLWTPAYWGYEGGHYGFHAGYWGEHVGFYGGVNYGYGYGGVGFAGGGWSGGHFRYNTAVVNVNTTVIHNTYIDKTVIVNNNNASRASFNGPGGYNARPRPEEQAAMREQHIQPTSEQVSHQQGASKDRNQFASVNNGHPTATAMNHVGGRPTNEQGHTATGSSMGHFNNANRTSPNPGNANANRPANNTGASNQANQQHNQLQQQGQQHNQQAMQQHSQPQQHNNNQQHGQSQAHQQHGGGQKPSREKH